MKPGLFVNIHPSPPNQGSIPYGYEEYSNKAQPRNLCHMTLMSVGFGIFHTMVDLAMS
jgi:hypothetical protein